MKFYSPLRYPGGKSKLAKFVALLCRENQISASGGHYVEPYAGGASVALYLLLEGHVAEITINDSDRAIYAVWHAILNDTDRLIAKIRRAPIDLKTWQKCREVQRQKDAADLFDLGFSTLFLNRTNVSGIIDGGVIGGQKQEGEYTIGCRFNKPEIVRRIRAIAKHRSKIHLHNLDALELIRTITATAPDSSTIFYFDPPYYLKGESLYLNAYEYSDHKDVSEAIQRINGARWLVSYDPAKEIKQLYKNYRKIEYSLWHTARTARMGGEVIFFSRNLKLPDNITDPTRV